MSSQHETFLPNEQSIVERKLSGVYGHAVIEIPFWIYQSFVEYAHDKLDGYDIKIDMLDLMENPLIQKNFAVALTKCAGDLDLTDLQYEGPDTATIFHKEISVAKQRQYEEEMAEKLEQEKRDAEQRIRDASEKTTIEVSKDNQARAMALLNIAGLL